MSPRRAAALAVVAVYATLYGCATLRPGSDSMTYSERRAYLRDLSAWDVSGRIAVRNGRQAFQGRFRWAHRDDALELTVRSPLGTNVLRVSGPIVRPTLEARGETYDLDDPETQLSELLGWWLPVASFESWLLGIADPDYAARERFGGDGTLASLEQRLWRIELEQYRLQAGVLLPQRMTLSHGDLSLRVVVDAFDSTP